MHVISSKKWKVLGCVRLRGSLEIQLRHPIFVMPKPLKLDFTTFKRALQNLFQIDYDNENDECNDDDGDNIDDNDDLKPDKYHGVIVKIYPIHALLPSEKNILLGCMSYFQLH